MTEERALRDYVAWHDDYLEPGSRLHRRLQLVIGLIGDAVSVAPPGPCRILSLCAGQGHDVLAVASQHRRGHDLVGRLVELDPTNAAAAGAAIAELGASGLEVVVADAGTTDASAGAVPADVVVACGIFGNLTLEDVEGTIQALPSLCAPGARVVWTRFPRDPADVLDRVAAWFDTAGFEPVSLEVPADLGYGVGLHRLAREPDPFEPGRRLFTFVR